MEIQNFWWIVLLTVSLLLLGFYFLDGFRIVINCVVRKQYKNIKKFEIRCFGLFILFENGNRLEIEKIWVRSGFFNSDLKSPIVICVSDIRFQGDVFWKEPQAGQRAEAQKPLWTPKSRFFKFISLQAYNLSIMQLGKPQSEFLLHVSIQDLILYFEEGIWINSSVTSSSIKVFKHFPLDQDENRTDSCLGHLSANIHLRIKFSSLETSLQKSLAECKLVIVQPELILYEGFSISKLQKHFSGKEHADEVPNVVSTNGVSTLLVNGDDNDNVRDKVTAKVINIFAKLPQLTSLQVDSFSLKLMKEGGHRAFTMDIKSIDFNLSTETVSEDSILPSFSSSFFIEEVLAATNHVQFAQLAKASFTLEVIKESVISELYMTSFIFSYNREGIQYWLGVIPLRSSEKQFVKNENMQLKKTWDFSSLFQQLYFKNTTILKNISIAAKLPACPAFTAGLSHCEMNLMCFGGECKLEKCNISADVSFELQLEMAYFKIGEEYVCDVDCLKRCHHWNIPFSVGMVLFKAKLNPDDSNIECIMDNTQLEWSPHLANLIIDIKKYSKTQESSRKAPVAKNPSKLLVYFKNVLKKQYSITFSLTSLNIYCLSDIQLAIMLRTDLAKIVSKVSKVKTSIEGLKLSTVAINSQSSPCSKASEIKSSIISILNATTTYHMTDEKISIELSEDISTLWNTTFHIALITLIDSVKTFNNKHTAISPVDVHTHVETKKAVFYIKMNGNINIGLTLSDEHCVTFSSKDVTAIFGANMKSAQTDKLCVIFDTHEIFIFKKLAFTLAPGTDHHTYNRSSIGGLECPNNRLLNINIEEFKLSFPYKYNFSDAFSEEFLGITKWLKQVHKTKKVAFTVDSLLPPDLHIKAKLWTIEVEDDPFEVKIRNNFELLEDEYHESLKRKGMFMEKFDSLRKTNLLLSGEKINELYMKLAEKNSEIYILRSKQLYQQEPMRTSLMTWQFEDIEILAIADTSYHGTDRVVNHIKLIDSESPYPEEGIEFNTLWARKVRCSASSWTCNLRDFPQSLLMIRGLHVWGFLIGAEQEGPTRAKRSSVIKIGEPWVNATVERNMPSLKFYHDLTFDMEEMCMSYGPCWEPPMTQFGLSMEYVSRPSLDPSPALPWWDKMRLLFHGRLTISTQHLSLLMRASVDPYNTTEQMELTWSDVIIEWTTGKILTKGDLDVYVHTASKYDDCRVLCIPSLKLSVSFDWLCLGNPHDHHNVVPCAPDKIPEYSINQEHDSYRAFRSENLNVSYSFETKPVTVETGPSMLLYSSTLRWIENLKMILSGVTRLTRRGKLFNNTKPRKPVLSRHYRSIRVSLNLHKFEIYYWMSFAKRQGLELVGGRLALSSENTLSLVSVNDGLIHRDSANWNIGYLNCELCDSEIWLYDCLQLEENANTADSIHAPIERSYFLSVNRVSYGREEMVKDVVSDQDKQDTPTHRLVVHGLRGAWTKHNRNVVFGLYDSYMKNISLKKNLSTDALRGFKVDTQNTPQKHRSQTNISQTGTAAPSPISHLQSGHAVSMLQQLISEAETNTVVFTEELEGSTREEVLHGVAACQTDDVLHKKWLIELVNSQVVLLGCETSGYVIVSAAKAQILQRIHRPVWKDRSLVSKTTWVGSFECMQYYGTVDAGESVPSMDNVMWLTVDNIDGRDSMVICDLPDLVGSGHSVGGVVSDTVGASSSDPGSGPIQLQRIVSRCGCQFFFASYGENVDPSTLEEVPPLPEELWTADLWEQDVAVDSFTLTHHDLEICTNSLQYAMILDLVNNLLLYVEPRKKEAIEKLWYMRFQLQLRSVDDQKEPILQLQEELRSLVSNLRRLEKEAYVVHKILCKHPEKEEYMTKLQTLENHIYDCKEKLNTMNEELTTMICCFKETQLIASKSRLRATSQEKGITVARRAEVCFKHAQWRLTDADGQLGIADLVLSNFLYSKVTKTDDSVEHLLEIGYVNVTNLLPNQLYKHILQPTDVKTSIPIDKQCMLRIFCRERVPVGGISVKEHLEVNIIPFTIGLTDAFYKAMLKFFFPGRDTEKEEHQEEQDVAPSHKKRGIRRRGCSIFYSDRDDIEKMKERAEKNHTFVYIKIPEVPIRVSYKGKKEKNIEDVENLNLVLTTLEYHNRTWTWLDLLMELKNDAKHILLTQAIKQKILKPKRNRNTDRDSELADEQKATLLFGSTLMNPADKSNKKNIFNLLKKGH